MSSASSTLFGPTISVKIVISESGTGCSDTRGSLENSATRYNIDPVCITDAGWRLPVPLNAGNHLTTSTAYDYGSQRYAVNHGFVHGAVDLAGSIEVPYTSATPVYSIGQGVVVALRTTSDGLAAVWIEYTAGNGETFIACYGHTIPLGTLQVGSSVPAGGQIGTLVVPGDPVHLHLELNESLSNFGFSGGQRTYGGVKTGTVDPLAYLIGHPTGTSPSIIYTISPNPATVSEGDGTITFTITRSGATPAETIYASTLHTEGSVNNGDYAGFVNQAVIFASGHTTLTIAIPILNDTTVENSENFALIVQRYPSDPNTTYLAKSTFTINDNDIANSDKSDMVVQGTPSTSPNPVTAGNEIAVSYTIRNQGLGAAGTSRTRIRVIDSTGVQLITAVFAEAALASGASAVRTRNVELPANSAPGNYTAVLYLDSRTELDQSDTGNDRAQTPVFTVRAASQPLQLPNLVFSSAFAATLETSGNNTLLTASATVQNSGVADSGPFTERIRVLNNAGAVLFTLSTAQNTLTHNSTGIASFNRIPLSTAFSPGIYTAELMLDSTDAVSEQNESDNVATTTFQVLAPSAVTVGEPSWTKWDPALFFTPGRYMPIDSIVIHTAAGSYQGTIDWFKNANNPYFTSSHYVISPQGEVTQMVLLEDTAHHATYYNARSIGIEVAGYASSASTWTPQVNASLRKLVAYLATRYSIPITHPEGDASTYAKLQYDQPGIVAHSQIQPLDNPTYPYEQKYDPGVYFDWVTFVDDVRTEYGLGALSFGASIDGSQQQSVGNRLASTPSTGTSMFPLSLMLNLPSERVVRVEHSSDLVSWVIESTVVLPEGTTDLNIDFGDANKEFYRVSWGYQK